MSDSEFKTTKFSVDMSCKGCDNAVERLFVKMNKENKEAIRKVDVDKDTKKKLTVEYKEPVTKEKILEMLKKWTDAAGKPDPVAINEGGRRTRRGRQKKGGEVKPIDLVKVKKELQKEFNLKFKNLDSKFLDLNNSVDELRIRIGRGGRRKKRTRRRRKSRRKSKGRKRRKSRRR